jgi:Ferritin-like
MSAEDIDGLSWLHRHLQTAVEIEWSTIPPYLCARWSLGDSANELAAECIDDVVMEEMLHLTLVSNVLNAVGGTPRFTPPDATLPSYPGYLPHSADAFQIELAPFSKSALETFCHMERPARAGAPPEGERYHTIAQFYEAVRDGMESLARHRNIFTGKAARQVGPAQYYGGGGGAFPVTDLVTARKALDVVVFEGEGIHESIWDGDEEFFQQERELAHYFRFNELREGRRYQKGDTPSTGPTGDPIFTDFQAVLPMRPNPKASEHPVGSELRVMSDDFNRTYSGLLRSLERAFGGHPNELLTSVQTMMTLRYQAIALMRVPVGDGLTAGPPFEWSG